MPLFVRVCFAYLWRFWCHRTGLVYFWLCWITGFYEILGRKVRAFSVFFLFSFGFSMHRIGVMVFTRLALSGPQQISRSCCVYFWCFGVFWMSLISGLLLLLALALVALFFLLLFFSSFSAYHRVWSCTVFHLWSFRLEFFAILLHSATTPNSQYNFIRKPLLIRIRVTHPRKYVA